MSQHAQPIFRLLADSRPSAVLSWLARARGRAVLAHTSQSARPVTHQMLDRLPPSPTIEYFRKALVAGQILPQRDERLAMFERWLDRAIGAVSDPQERRIIRRFAIWNQLRPLREKAAKRRLSDGQVQRARCGVKAAIALTSWLRANSATLATCTQRHIDRWLAEGTSTSYNARPFVLWCCRNGHLRDTDIPYRQSRELLPRIEDDQRWALASRLLHDSTIHPEDRVAGLLLLLYGQPVSKVAQLKREQVIGQPGATQILLGEHPLEIPPPLDELLLAVAVGHQGRAVLASTDDNPWLFPGGAPGLPLGATQLRKRLLKLGIPARPARNSALFDLAGQLPAVVLSKLLDIGVTTATRWTRRANASGAAYAAAAAQEATTPQQS